MKKYYATKCMHPSKNIVGEKKLNINIILSNLITIPAVSIIWTVSNLCLLTRILYPILKGILIATEKIVKYIKNLESSITSIGGLNEFIKNAEIAGATIKRKSDMAIKG